MLAPASLKTFMNQKLRSFAEQGLFAVVVFVLFLLVFAHRIVIPMWLQPLGRMHPLFLHFPIVILLLALMMEAFRFRVMRNQPEQAEFYRDFLSGLLLVGSLTAGLTVIMGLFLANEDGYSGQVLNWHKWSGVGVFLLSALIYWARKRSWYSARLAQVGALAGVVFLIGAGHYGATLTHGEDFLFKPLSDNAEAPPVPLEQAMVFDHVIQPILEQKCVSCHNPDKLKGQLSLASLEGIQKGGKSGKLFVAGRPDISLLLQRIHLPEAEKKHMPPIGKAQLTPDEIRLLALWVKGRDLNRRVADLPVTDSLRYIAAARFGPVQAEETYAFDAPDEEAVRTLNTDYRTVAFLAKDSPALAVNLYNRAAFSSDQLAELQPVREQVIALNLNKLPAKDSDMKQVKMLENLEVLHLNFTDVTGNGLAELTGLKNLKTLSLAGTKVSFADLQKHLPAFPNLKTVSVWNTTLTPAQIGQLKKAFPTVRFISGEGPNEIIRLNPPQLANASPIFDQSLTVQLRHPIKGVEIRYTTDGSEPDSVSSPILTNRTVITQPTSIKAKAYKTGWYSSPVATFDFYKSTIKPDSVNLLFPLSDVHQADGAKTFFNGILGAHGANSPAWANHWAGVRNNDLAFVAEFKKPVRVSSVGLRVLVEEDTGIFPPGVVEIWGGNSRDKLTKLATVRPAQPALKTPHEMRSVTASFTPQTVTFLKVVAQPLQKIPEPHNGKGNRALLLVDEAFIN